MKTWQGRIDVPASPIFESFTSSVAQDRRLAPYDVRASRAHAGALELAGVITQADGLQLDRALAEIAEEIERGDFVWRHELEDVHTHVEIRLREKVGESAGALHAGRSRNDQIAADLRLYVLDRTHEALLAILDLQEALIDLAARYRDAIMPGYTHLQQAQPLSIAQPLLAHAAMLGRDWERFHDSLSRADRSPLGSGALAGATFDLDRDFLARESGFGAVAANSLDAVSDRDFVVEFIACAALCMTHLSRFSEDLILWSSVEFGFVRLPDAFASGSSMMPQKKNPDVAELIRGKTALVLGDVSAALALVKGIPLGYNRDLQEDKTPLFHAADTILPSLDILAAMIPLLEFDTMRTESAVSSFILATDVADHLVRRGVPFREAHAIVGRLVSDCVAQGRSLSDLTPAELEAVSPHLRDLPELTARASIRRKRTAGSTHPDEIERQLRAAGQEIDDRRALLPSPKVGHPPGEGPGVRGTDLPSPKVGEGPGVRGL
jgi:argininosuccinate lyase